MLAAPLFATPYVPGARDWSFDQVVGFLRFLSVLLVLPLPLIVFHTARRMYGSVPVATGAAAVPLAIPQLVHIGAAVEQRQPAHTVGRAADRSPRRRDHGAALLPRRARGGRARRARAADQRVRAVHPGMGRGRLRAGDGALRRPKEAPGSGGDRARRDDGTRGLVVDPQPRRIRTIQPGIQLPLAGPDGVRAGPRVVARAVRAEHDDHVLEPGAGTGRSGASAVAQRDGDRGGAPRCSLRVHARIEATRLGRSARAALPDRRDRRDRGVRRVGRLRTHRPDGGLTGPLRVRRHHRLERRVRRRRGSGAAEQGAAPPEPGAAHGRGDPG